MKGRPSVGPGGRPSVVSSGPGGRPSVANSGGRPSVIVHPGLGLSLQSVVGGLGNGLGGGLGNGIGAGLGAGLGGGMGSLLIPKMPSRRVSRVSTVHNMYMSEVSFLQSDWVKFIVTRLHRLKGGAKR